MTMTFIQGQFYEKQNFCNPFLASFLFDLDEILYVALTCLLKPKLTLLGMIDIQGGELFR